MIARLPTILFEVSLFIQLNKTEESNAVIRGCKCHCLTCHRNPGLTVLLAAPVSWHSSPSPSPAGLQSTRRVHPQSRWSSRTAACRSPGTLRGSPREVQRQERRAAAVVAACAAADELAAMSTNRQSVHFPLPAKSLPVGSRGAQEASGKLLLFLLGFTWPGWRIFIHISFRKMICLETKREQG